MLSRFEIHRAETVAEAIDLRRRFGEDATLYAGGTEIILAMKTGLARWPHLIDVKRIDELRGVRVVDGVLSIGATVTHRELERDAAVIASLPSLARLASAVANVRVRAAGTLGGNLAFAEPHADPATLLIALGARVVLVGGGGERTVLLSEFLTGMYQTALGPDEIIVRIEVPLPRAEARATYVKFQILERPSVGVAAVATLADGRFVEAPVFVVGAVDETPRAIGTATLAGARATDAVVRDALSSAARDAVAPVADLAGSVEYKHHLVGVFTLRALDALLEAA